MNKIVYLVPAPDMDERSIQAVQLEGCTVVPLLLQPVDSATELSTYIQDLCTQIRHERPTLVGACYGGALAIEISKQIEVEKLVIVACVKNRNELTLRWRILYHSYLAMPLWLEKSLGMSLAFIVNKILRLPIKIPRLWLKSGQNKFIVRHLLQLTGGPKNLVHVHGRYDGVFPISAIKNVDIVVDSGHFMLDKSRRAALTAIEQAVQRL